MDATPHTGGPDGVAPAAVTWWLQSRTELTPPLTFSAITGGRSNLTYRVEDATGRRWVLRRPPLNSVLASAHDVAREHRVMAALADSAVPVPPMVGLEPDAGVLDAPFFVMEYVEGLVVRHPADAESLDGAARNRVGAALVEVLARLHAVDPDEVGLGDLGRRSDYLARQLHRWHRQYTEGGSREVPAIDGLHARLVAGIPAQQASGIVHGDYRLDNLLVTAGGEVAAVLDWELCTLGDPLADLGLLAVYWDPFGSGDSLPSIPAAAGIDGLGSFDDVVERYTARSSLDLSPLPTYVTFGYWKLAVILEGVLARSRAGAYGEPDDETVDGFAGIVDALLERGQVTADTAGI